MTAYTSTSINFRPIEGATEQLLTTAALHFLLALHQKFNPQRLQLLQQRAARKTLYEKGALPDFLTETASVRNGDWQVASIPESLLKRNVEITGPVDKKMVINALNSGADVFMADFEDANAPTWDNIVSGQLNLSAALRRNIDFVSNEGKTYALNEKVATLFIRPRGWHLTEAHCLVEKEPISGSLFDFGLYFFHNAVWLLENGKGVYCYLPKIEHYLEARLWNEIFEFSQDYLGIPRGSIRVTVLIETILASLQMEEIIYELKEHIVALNAGRWDYIFSVIKKFGTQSAFILPDRSQVTMQVPFMRSYATLLVQTCHRRGAHAMGGMAAFIPNRKDAEVNRTALEKVTADKTWEAALGFDGTWVAHPDLVPVARAAFDAVLNGRPHQKEIIPEGEIPARQLLDVSIPNGRITRQGFLNNIDVGIRYIASWLNGVGAAAIHNLMEDAATAEISRAQIWQWLKHECLLEDRTPITTSLIEYHVISICQNIKDSIGDTAYSNGHFAQAANLFLELVFQKKFEEFLTLPAYQLLD